MIVLGFDNANGTDATVLLMFSAAGGYYSYSYTPSIVLKDPDPIPSTFAPPVRPARPIVPKRPRPTRRFFTQTIGHAGRTMRA